MKEAYYKPSGKLTANFFLYFVLFTIIGAPILSVVYIYLIHYIPFIYLNFMIAILCGMALGALVLFAAKLGKARNPLAVLVCTLIAAIFMKYIQWCVYVPLTLDNVFGLYEAYGIDMTLWGRFEETYYYLSSPGEVYDWVVRINEVGAWGIGSGAAVKGGMLLFVWIAEFALMAATSVVISRRQARFPYSEESDGWYTKINKKIDMDMPFDFAAMRNSMESGDFTDFVRNATAGKANNDQYLMLKFYEPPRQLPQEPYYLDITAFTTAKRGKKSMNMLVQYLAIDAQTANRITSGTASLSGNNIQNNG